MTSWQNQIGPIKAYPASINGLANGKFPDSALSPITGSVPGRMCHEAARCWNAMAAAAQRDGVALSTEGPAGSYRTYAGQVVVWDLYKSGRGNLAAKPGTSNHGLGLANDVLNADRPGPVLSWLEAHAATYGFGWETQESWHIHYIYGDAIPQAVLDYEHHGDDDMAKSFLGKGDDGSAALYLVDGSLTHAAHLSTMDEVTWLQQVHTLSVQAGGQGFLVDTQIHTFKASLLADISR